MRIDDFEALIRAGRSREARTGLRQRFGRGRALPDRAEREAWASLCRRSGWAEGGLILLSSVVRPSARSAAKSTEGERVEYSACLVQLGLLAEARALLDEIGDGVPRKHLIRAMSLFCEWDYRGALPSLRDYVLRFGLDDYQRAVGEVNLAAALVFLAELDEADELLARLRETCERRGYLLLLGNSFEIQAQAEIQRKRWARAEECLDRSHDLLRTHANVDAIFLMKWRSVLKLRREGPSAERRAEIEAVIERAKRDSHWETWRDCEYHWLRAEADEDRAQALFFGTPHRSFRDRVRKDFGPFGESYSWRLAEGAKPRVLDVVHGVARPRGEALKPGQVRQRMLAALASDFYAPSTVPRLFAAVFPSQHYESRSSSAVVHQALKRLREWIAAENLPLVIEEKNATYRLRAIAPLSLRVHASDDGNWKRHSVLSRAAEAFGERAFTRAELGALLGVSPRTANGELRALAAEGALAREGAGPGTKYRLYPRRRENAAS